MSSDKLKAAIIGLGVGERHVSGYESDERCEVLALCDMDPVKLEEVRQRIPGKWCTIHPEEVLEHRDIDVVSIASYEDAHAKQIIAAVQNGKHVFVEKPLCLTEDEFQSIGECLLKHKDVKLSSNLILRKTPRFVDLKKRIQSQSLGDIYYLEGDYDYGRLHKLTEGWRGRIPNYSVVHGGAIHMIDLICWLLEKKVVEVYACGNNISTRQAGYPKNDLAVALLTFTSGETAKVSANFACVAPHFHRLSVYGTRGTFEQSHSGAIYMHSRKPDVEPEVVSSAYPGAAKGDMIPSFVRSILEDTAMDVSTQEVFDAMAVSLAIERSMTTGKPVRPEYFNFN